jgi:hypothetical protein
MTVGLKQLSVSDDDSMSHYADITTAAGPQMAFSILDAMRAVKQSGNITDVDPSPLITMYGYSGGGVAAAWVSDTKTCWAFQNVILMSNRRRRCSQVTLQMSRLPALLSAVSSQT